MEILNIHAGITDEEIVKFLFDEKEFEEIMERVKNSRGLS